MANEVGRNDPCPCGSGKKYKKCCLKNKKQKFSAKVIQGGTGMGLRSLMGLAAKQIHEDTEDFHKRQEEKKQTEE